MNYLVDTHIFVWAMLSSGKISREVRGIFLDSDATKFVSVITLWEISLKFSLGKIDLEGILPDELYDRAKEMGFQILDLKPEVVCSFHKLPKIAHKDPFDRMLVWQSVEGDYTLLPHDKELSGFKIHGLKIVLG